jgi:hypothetical protein
MCIFSIKQTHPTATQIGSSILDFSLAMMNRKREEKKEDFEWGEKKNEIKMLPRKVSRMPTADGR